MWRFLIARWRVSRNHWQQAGTNLGQFGDRQWSPVDAAGRIYVSDTQPRNVEGSHHRIFHHIVEAAIGSREL
jgi:hypothetical protein